MIYSSLVKKAKYTAQMAAAIVITCLIRIVRIVGGTCEWNVRQTVIMLIKVGQRSRRQPYFGHFIFYFFFPSLQFSSLHHKYIEAHWT